MTIIVFFLCRPKQVKTVDEFNPYSSRQIRLLELESEKTQTEADSFTNAPPNIARAVWERFVEFRKKRNDLEREVSQNKVLFFVMQTRTSCLCFKIFVYSTINYKQKQQENN